MPTTAATPPTRPTPAVHYPDSDGEPMADNTLQFDWIALLKWNAERCLRDDPAVYVAGDHLIYPVQGDADLRHAPGVSVAIGRPKGYCGSYKVWEEGGVFPQVVFEVWSPNNRQGKMEEKRRFYERHGAEEYYIVYPDFPMFVEGWLREEGRLVRLADEAMADFTSPRLRFRCVSVKGQLTVFGPDGRELRRPDEITRERDVAEREREEEKRRKDEAEERAARLASRLRELVFRHT